MSTAYYFVSNGKTIGQTNGLGKDKGYHFIWCMYPLEYARLRTMGILIKDEYGNTLWSSVFEDIVDNAKYQSFDERIA